MNIERLQEIDEHLSHKKNKPHLLIDKSTNFQIIR